MSSSLITKKRAGKQVKIILFETGNHMTRCLWLAGRIVDVRKIYGYEFWISHTHPLFAVSSICGKKTIIEFSVKKDGVINQYPAFHTIGHSREGKFNRNQAFLTGLWFGFVWRSRLSQCRELAATVIKHLQTSVSDSLNDKFMISFMRRKTGEYRPLRHEVEKRARNILHIKTAFPNNIMSKSREDKVREMICDFREGQIDQA